MKIITTKVTELPKVGDVNDFEVFGVDKSTGKSARADMEQLRGNKGDTGGMINISGPFPWNGISLQTTATDIPFKADAGVMDSDYIMVVGNVVVSGTPKKLFAFSNVIPIWKSYVAGEYLSVFSVAAQSINVYVTGANVNPDGSTTSIRMIKDNSSATVAVYITDVYLMPKT